MKYLGLFFHAHMQSWGSINSPESNSESPKRTENSPTKSAIIGLIRSAMGVKRGEEDNYDLKNIRMLTRTDVAGKIVRDYQVAQRTHHGFVAGTTKVIPKYHLENATFLVLLGHESNEIIEKIEKALLKPQWAPFIGRRAYVPSLPILLGTIETFDPVEELKKIPVFWSIEERRTKNIKITDSRINSKVKKETFFDDPLSWNMKERKYGDRSFSVYNYNFSPPETSLKTIEQYQFIKERFK